MQSFTEHFQDWKPDLRPCCLPQDSRRYVNVNNINTFNTHCQIWITCSGSRKIFWDSYIEEWQKSSEQREWFMNAQNKIWYIKLLVNALALMLTHKSILYFRSLFGSLSSSISTEKIDQWNWTSSSSTTLQTRTSLVRAVKNGMAEAVCSNSSRTFNLMWQNKMSHH